MSDRAESKLTHCTNATEQFAWLTLRNGVALTSGARRAWESLETNIGASPETGKMLVFQA
ncbi:MAG: hypothetical protein AAGA74_19570 [Pseudomonadota bacterium]